MPGPQADRCSTFLPDVETKQQDGPYRRLVEAARARGDDYSHIWDLFAFQNDVMVHLSRLTEGIIRKPASISIGMRELIAAYTSYLNECGFCTEAHAAAAGELLGHDLVWAALRDVDGSPLSDSEKALLRFVAKVTTRLPAVTGEDVETLRATGWDDEAIYFAISSCALFNFYNRWISACGVPRMSKEAHLEQGRRLALNGYNRD